MAVSYLHRMQLAAALLAARTVAFNLDGANLVAETGAADPFRVGSGAVAAAQIYDKKIENLLSLGKAIKLNPDYGSTLPSLPTPGRNPAAMTIGKKLYRHNFKLPALIVVSLLVHMMPQLGAGGGGGEQNFNYRIPPKWAPEADQTYSFRAYMTDIPLWIMLTDLQPHQQCAAIIMRLGGGAREMARAMSPQEMMNGGMLNGVMVDSVTYLLGLLHARFSALEEESRLTAMTEMLAFRRRHGQSINALLARYEVVRQRAAVEGQFVMSIEG